MKWETGLRKSMEKLCSLKRWVKLIPIRQTDQEKKGKYTNYQYEEWAEDITTDSIDIKKIRV